MFKNWKTDWFWLLSPARIFLGLLIILVLINCWLNLQTRSQNLRQQTVSLRILSSQTDNFGQIEYTVWSDNKIWQASFPSKALSVGTHYRARAKMENLLVENFEQKFANYDLSLGVNGRLEILAIIATKCDLECHFWQQLHFGRQNLQTHYRQTLCGTFAKVTNFLSGNQCMNVFGLTNGLVLGGTNQFDSAMRQNFRTLGLSHLVAVSGFQVVLLITYLELGLNQIRLTRFWKLLAGLLAIVGLVLLVGPQPPVLRSGVSLLLAQSALFFLGKKISPIRSLIFSALILLLINPFYILSVSFQLSFLASLGLVVGLQSETLAGLWSESKIVETARRSLKTAKKDSGSLDRLANFNQQTAQKLPAPTTTRLLENKNGLNLQNLKSNQTEIQTDNLSPQQPQLTGTVFQDNQEHNTPQIKAVSKNTADENLPTKLQNTFDFVGQLFWATVNSFIFTLPIIINLSGQISPIAILTNLLIVPIIPILTYLNLLGLIPFLGVFPLFIAGICQSWLILLINDLSRLNWLWKLSTFSALEMLLYYSCLIIFLSIFKSWKKSQVSNISKF